MSANNTQDDAIEWRAIPGWEELYEASNDGRIRSLPRLLARTHFKYPDRVHKRIYGGKILTPKIGTAGYKAVSLYRNNRGSTIEVHRLICAAFTGIMRSDRDVNHLNGCRTDNRVSNVEWATRKENLLHAESVLGTKMVWTHQKERALQRRMAT